MTPPRFVPFSDMTEQEQREHLRRVHDTPLLSATDSQIWHSADHNYGFAMRDAAPHTHDKPTRSVP